MHVGGARSASRKFHGSGWAADLADDLEPVFGCGGGFGLGRRYSVRDGEYCQEYDGEYGKGRGFLCLGNIYQALFAHYTMGKTISSVEIYKIK